MLYQEHIKIKKTIYNFKKLCIIKDRLSFWGAL